MSNKHALKPVNPKMKYPKLSQLLLKLRLSTDSTISTSHQFKLLVTKKNHGNNKKHPMIVKSKELLDYLTKKREESKLLNKPLSLSRPNKKSLLQRR